ncbi:DUF3311 domain-containing protein [Terrilactibacillus sp. BCM23-1]|uniref:DUF3311 domain-containing protein n=1 Tax=Terrilactibacillus tamarindi TaxID=2599694 RepID=A0A6N8CRX3_9BACI|nr:DUF3311 domain-containing protein [Terrilactibacillus tamarindi]MTT32914.1 DUF3311 domain-containing protein [Terrilactibacillus tamarindi]
MQWIILLIIIIMNIGVLPLVNRVHPIIIGMPFFLFWYLLSMIVTPILSWWIYVIGKKKHDRDVRSEEK